jgi:hypothetical protein
MAETEAPGAPISGLIRVVFSFCGPREEEPTMVFYQWDANSRIKADHNPSRQIGLEQYLRWPG